LKTLKLKLCFEKIWNWHGGAVLLLWANTLFPFGINRQKRVFRAIFTFSPMVQMNMSEDYTKVESNAEWQRRVNNAMEWSGSLVFAEDSISLSIYDLAWNTLENTLVIANERDMIKGI
jgi:nitrogen fixation protein FixH